MKAILVDNEILALKFLQSQLEELKTTKIIGSYTSIDFTNDNNLIIEADVIFLDIEMPEINGLELAERLLQINPEIAIVFVTAFPEYAVSAFELNALDYLTKPVNLDRLDTTLTRLREKRKNQDAHIKNSDQVLEISLFHDLSFQMENKRTYLKWRTNRSKEIFLYLLYNRGKGYSVKQLGDLHWDDSSTEDVSKRLYTCIYHIRNTLKKFEDHFSLENINGLYYLKTKNIEIDCFTWEKKLNSLNEINPQTLKDWEDVVDMYKDSFLDSHDIPWIENERFRIQGLWSRAAFKLAAFYKNNQQIEKAEYLYQKIYTLIPEEENAHFELMKIYDELGLGLLIDSQYKLLTKIYKDNDMTISPHIERWLRDRLNMHF